APVETRDASYSVSYVIGVAGLVALGPAAAAIAASFGGFVHIGEPLQNKWRVPFNSAQLALTSGVSGATYVALGGPVGSVGADDFPRVFLALVVASIVHFVVNAVL